MKVLAVSHSCVADVNQQLFVALRQLPDVELELLIPATWKNEYTSTLIEPRLLPAVDFPIHLQPIVLAGNVSLHFYKRLPWKRLYQFKPDVVLSSQEPWSLSGWQAMHMAKKLNAAFVFQTNQNIIKVYPLPFSHIEQASYRAADVALAYSEEARQVMIAKGRVGASAVLPYGTDLTLFYSGATPLRETLGLTGHTIIGYMGRLVKEKGLDILVQALAYIKQQRPNLPVKILIVGSGEEEAVLRQLVASANLEPYVVFAGAVPHGEAGHYMRCVDIFVLPSRTMPHWKEQFGRVIIEAMACHIPVIGSDSGQIPHLIKETGGGLIFKEGDATDLAKQLMTLLAQPDKRTQHGLAGAEAVRCGFTYEAVARQLHKFLQKALEAHGASWKSSAA